MILLVTKEKEKKSKMYCPYFLTSFPLIIRMKKKDRALHFGRFNFLLKLYAKVLILGMAILFIFIHLAELHNITKVYFKYFGALVIAFLFAFLFILSQI